MGTSERYVVDVTVRFGSLFFDIFQKRDTKKHNNTTTTIIRPNNFYKVGTLQIPLDLSVFVCMCVSVYKDKI